VLKRFFKKPKVEKPLEEEELETFLLSGELVARPAFLVGIFVFLIVCSSLAVTYAAFEYRNLFNQQQKLVQQWDDFQVEWGQLLLEQSALGANSRVELLAVQELGMMAPKPEMIEIVIYER
jgi:cell division protein FtsL